jgi:2-methylisocitrate lyase-like PEP mutase family enzyme
VFRFWGEACCEEPENDKRGAAAVPVVRKGEKNRKQHSRFARAKKGCLLAVVVAAHHHVIVTRGKLQRIGVQFAAYGVDFVIFFITLQ